MRKIKITSDCLHEGQHTPAGTVLTLEVLPAQRLLDAGVAVEIKPGTVRGPGNEPAVENRDEAPADRDPKPATKRAKRAAAPAADPAPAAEPDAEPAPADPVDAPAE